MLNTLRKFFLLTAIALLALLPLGAQAARHALLIGNDNYEDVPTLRNARADADAMAMALQKAGYTVTVMKDRDLKEMKDDVRNFRSQIKGGDEVIFFYSGHGVQIEAMNYLLPVDVRAESEDQVRDDALALSRVLEDLREQKPALTMAVIDACRDNPFKGTGRAIGGRGLTGVGGANGQMVIYSAGEGQQALDRLSDGDPVKNGLFTRVFIKEMTQPGVPIDQVARTVRAEVNRMAHTVNHEQVPAIYDQVIGQFYFYAQNDAGVDDVEILFWQSVKDSNDATELQAYLDKYPDGQFSALAQARISRIGQSAAAAAATPPPIQPPTTPAAVPAPSAPPAKPEAEPEAAPAPSAPPAEPEAVPAPSAQPAQPAVPAAPIASPAMPTATPASTASAPTIDTTTPAAPAETVQTATEATASAPAAGAATPATPSTSPAKPETTRAVTFGSVPPAENSPSPPPAPVPASSGASFDVTPLPAPDPTPPAEQ